MNNRPISDRRNHRIDRSGSGKRGVESSGKLKINSYFARPNGRPNRKVIVDRFAVIVNSAALSLSTIHQQIAGIHQSARRHPGVQLQESSDNHPIDSGNHPTDSANLPIIYRHIAGIYRSDWCRASQSSDCGHLVHRMVALT